MQAGAAVQISLGTTAQIPTRLTNGMIIAGVSIQNLSGFALVLGYGSNTAWVPPFTGYSIPQSQLGTITVQPVNVGLPSGAGSNYVLPTYYGPGETLPPPGALVAAPLPIEIVSQLGQVDVYVQGVGGVGMLSAQSYGSGTPALIVEDRPPYQVLVYEASLAAAATADIIVAAVGQANALRNIHVCCDTIPTAGNAVIIHFGSSASASDVGSVSSPIAQAMAPQDLPFGDWTIGQNSATVVKAKPLYITNAGADTIQVRVTVLYTQAVQAVTT